MQHLYKQSALVGGICLLLIFLVIGINSADSAGGGSTQFLPVLAKPPLPPTTIQLEQVNQTPLSTCSVTDIANAGDDRLFIVQQDGIIRIMEPNGEILEAPFLDLSDRISHPCGTENNWELGMLGLAFHPRYHSNGFFYVTYTSQNLFDIIVARFQVSDDDPNIADAESRDTIMRIKKPYDKRLLGPSPVHNGGDLNFGPDGFLYIATGDGGPDPVLAEDPAPGDPFDNAQSNDVLLGKILRIDIDRVAGEKPDCGGDFYRIPEDNPFYDDPERCGEIWSYGWRNPWRFSFDSLTGDMWVGDVGEWQKEEVSLERAGRDGGLNYGWRCWEGTHDHSDEPAAIGSCPLERTVKPIHDYSRGSQGCSIVGGFVYRGFDVPSLWGQYLYVDFCHNEVITRIDSTSPNNSAFDMEINNLARTLLWSTMGLDQDGEIYLSHFSGDPNGPVNIFRVIDN